MAALAVKLQIDAKAIVKERWIWRNLIIIIERFGCLRLQ